MWSNVQSIAQFAGLDIFQLISAIVRASERACQNKKICKQLARDVEQIHEILKGLEQQPGIGIMRHPAMSNPLRELKLTLELARDLVESCSSGGYVRGLFAGSSRATKLRDVQKRIAFFLKLFPMITHLDMTRLLTDFFSSLGVQGDLANIYPHGDNRFHFSFSQMTTATNNFSIENLIVQGPMSILYKGDLDGNRVTVKKIITSSLGQPLAQSMRPLELLKNEVKILSKLQHKNIVELVGICAERSDEGILVYEYMENGTLEHVIFERIATGLEVDWRTRRCIIEGVAQGAVYLHHHSRLRIIHCDMKPSNILLDSEMKPRISNFFLGKILSDDMDEGTAECVVGSIGYIAPEYMKDGTFSDKTDVYSFGVMVLEIISGKRWTKELQETYYRYLRSWAFKGSLRCGVKVKEKLKNFVDPLLHKIAFPHRGLPGCISFQVRRALLQQKEIRRCVQVALLCIQENPKQRRDMIDVGRLLKLGKVRVPFPHRPSYANAGQLYAGSMT